MLCGVPEIESVVSGPKHYSATGNPISSRYSRISTLTEFILFCGLSTKPRQPCVEWLAPPDEISSVCPENARNQLLDSRLVRQLGEGARLLEWPTEFDWSARHCCPHVVEVSHASLETGFSAAPYPPLPAAGGIISITNIINSATLLSFIRLCFARSRAGPLGPVSTPPPSSGTVSPCVSYSGSSVCCTALC